MSRTAIERCLWPLAAAAAVLGSAMLFGPLAPARAAAQNPVSVRLDSMSPSAAKPGDTLKLAGSLVAPAGSSFSGVSVRLGVADLSVRSDMANAAGSDSNPVFDDSDTVGSLAAGATVPWSLSVPVSALNLMTQHSVYAIDVEAWSDGGEIGVTRTYLPYDMSGDSAFQPTQMVLLWPVTAQPSLDGHSVTGVPEASQDQAVQQFAPGGRLAQVLADPGQVSGLTVSWLVDPDLLQTAANEQYGYTLYPNGATGAGSQDAAQWLAAAKTDLGGASGELWQVPATDPDFDSLAAADPAFAGQMVQNAKTLTGTTVKDLVGRTPSGMVAWPANGQADPAAVSLAQSAGPSAVLLDSGSVDLRTPSNSYTPTGLSALSGGTPLAISDTDLDSIFDGDPADAAYSGSSQSLLASQRFLALSALIALERPYLSTPRTIVVTPPRQVQPNLPLLQAVGQASGWIKTVGLSTLLSATPDPEARTNTPAQSSASAAENLTADQLAAAESANTSLQSLEQVLTDPKQTTASYSPAVLRAVSTSWRGAASAQEKFTAAVGGRLSTSVDAVHLVPKANVTLSGKSGQIPFTIENQLSLSVRVGIRVTTDRSGLTVHSIAVQTIPEGSTTVEVPVDSTVSGASVTVTAQLVTDSGTPFGTPESLTVSVSSIGTITLVVFALSAALLVVGVVLRIYRGRRRRREQPAEAGPGESARNDSTMVPERRE
ncbi:MAG TPA: DUF6049 family protein [Actinocrinis sp.]